MPPRRKTKRTRRKFTGINISRLAESYAYLHLTTKTFFGESPKNFLLGTSSRGPYALSTIGQRPSSGSGKISIYELFNWDQYNQRGLGEQLWMNLGGGSGLLMYGIKTAGIGVGFRVANKLLRRPRAEANKMLRMGGLGNEVRV
jgi:hypothetical protein